MFTKARLRLTTWYLLIIMVVSVAFSAVIFEVLTREVKRFARAQRFRIERGFPDTQLPFDIRIAPISEFNTAYIDPDLVSETKARILSTLIIINGVILVLSGGFGYILAGRTLSPIQDMLDEQARFISDASHELKTPITAIKSMMEVELRNSTMTIIEAKAALRGGVSEMNRLQKLTQSLLELTQSEYKEKALPLSTVSLEAVVSEAKRRVQALLVQKAITLSIEGKEVYVKGNADRLQDACVILLDNAIKYSPKKSTIIINFGKKKGHGTLTIADHGIGIAAKDLPNIFERFYRGDASRSKNESEGFGLGLPIAKRIIDMHNGTVEVKSIKGKGTTVVVEIPLSKRV